MTKKTYKLIGELQESVNELIEAVEELGKRLEQVEGVLSENESE
jgi:hypothetical protein